MNLLSCENKKLLPLITQSHASMHTVHGILTNGANDFTEACHITEYQ